MQQRINLRIEKVLILSFRKVFLEIRLPLLEIFTNNHSISEVLYWYFYESHRILLYKS